MKDIFKSNKFVIFAIVLLIVVSLFAVAFAYFTPLITEGNIFSTTGNAVNNAPDFTFTEITEGGINLEGTYPMTDEVGMTTDPYTFKITNNERTASIDYEIIMETKSNNTLPNSLVTTNFSGVLTSCKSVQATQTGYNVAYVLSTGTLKAQEEKVFELKVWINESGTLENAQNKTWRGKIVVRAVKEKVIETDADKTLAALNAAFYQPLQAIPTNFNMFNYTSSGYKAVCNNYDLYNCTYELALTSEQQARAWGIFPIEDDFGKNYFFRGSAPIVKYGTFNKNYYSYPAYSHDEFTDFYLPTGYDLTGTLEECQNSLGALSGQFDCTSLTPIITAGDSMYWHIVRILSDGSLRLLYKGTSPTATGAQSYLTTKGFAAEDPMSYGVYTYGNSNIKPYLEEWFDDNLRDEMANLTTSLYIDELEGLSVSIGFSRSTLNPVGTDISVTNSVLRLEKNSLGHTTDVSPSLKEPTIINPSFSYTYEGYIGLLSVDEAVLSGFDGVFGAENYGVYPYTVNTSKRYWLNGSPGLTGLGGLDNYTKYVITPVGSIYYEESIYMDDDSAPAIVPVITLSSNAAQKLQGDGSTIIPYELPD